MDNIWTILELEPTKDIPAIRNAFAWKAETCKQEDYPLLLQAYQAALDQAKPQEDASSKNKQTFGDMDARLLANQNWTFSPNPYAHSPAIQKFLDLYTGKQRKNAKEWLDYFTSGCFLDAAWNKDFTALLLEHVTRLEDQYPVNREFLIWLCTAYQFTVTQAVYSNPDGSQRTEYQFHISPQAQFDGQESIFLIAVKGPAPKHAKGNELAIRYSFQEYRHLIRLAEDNVWGEEQIGAFSQIIGCYAPRYVTDKCQQKGDRDHERHPAGLKVITHFFRRNGLPDELYQLAWQKLDLKTAVMGRSKIFWGPLRDLALAHVPKLDGQPQVSFAKLRTDFHDYAVSTYKQGGQHAQADEKDIRQTDAFFARNDLQLALLDRRFVEEEMLHTWVTETRCDYYLQTVIRFYTNHADAPCAKLVIDRAKQMLQYQKLADRLQRDRESAVPEHSLTLKNSPFFRHWLNTGFYQARNPKTGAWLLEYLNEKLPFLPEWSKKLVKNDENGIPIPHIVDCTLEGSGENSTEDPIRTNMANDIKDDHIQVLFHLRYIEFLLNGAPVYRPCLPWERVAALSDTDAFFFLLPITVAVCHQFDQVALELSRRLADTAAPEEDLEIIAACLAGQVCRLPLPEDMEPDDDLEDMPKAPLTPQSTLPFELLAENSDHLYGCAWIEPTYTLQLFEQWPGMRCWKNDAFYEDIFDAQTAVTLARQLLKETLSPAPLPVELLTDLPDAVYALPDFTAICRDGSRFLGSNGPVELLGDTVAYEALIELLEDFFADRCLRLELSWTSTIPLEEEEGYEPRRSLVFMKNSGWYACLYFDDLSAKSYALLEKPELYGKQKDGLSFVPFNQGRLFRQCLHKKLFTIRQHLSAIFTQASRPNNIIFQAGGIWDHAVNVSHRRTKYNLDKQLLGDFPMEWSHNRPDAPFYFDCSPADAAWVDDQGHIETLNIGENMVNRNRLQQTLTQFLRNRFSKLRMTWGKEEGRRSHIVLLQDMGRFLMVWLTEETRTAEYHVADHWTYLDVEGKKYPKDTFQGRVTPAYLIHDLIPLRNALDLLLANINNPKIVTNKFAEYAGEKPVKARPYETLWTELVGDTMDRV